MLMNLQYHNELNSGYGRFGVRTVEALKELGVEDAGDIGDGTERPEQLAQTALWLSTPPHVKGWYDGQFAAIFTMWESTVIPPGFRENLHNFDRIIVPSQQNLELYRQYHDDVRWVPLGIDPSWSGRARPPIDRDFTFLTCGYGPRKGVKQVADAFHKVFYSKTAAPRSPLSPVPKLICKSRDDVSGPGIVRMTQTLSMKDELDLFAKAHCYVSGSKGEGWGFFPSQAIAQGCPTILGDAHGQHEFSAYAIPIDTHPFDATGATFWGDGGEWWEPDFDQMCEAMWDVYCNYDRYREQASMAAASFRRQFTWEHTAEGILFELADQLGRPEREIGDFCPCKVRLFPVWVNKQCQFTINGVTRGFTPGKRYDENSEVQRAILAAGHYDMRYFNPHDLGREDDIDLEDLRAHNERCPMCHQRYNSDPSMAELRV